MGKPTVTGEQANGAEVAAVMRLLRGEDLKTIADELGVPAAVLSQWRDVFLAAGTAALTGKTGSEEKLEHDRLKARLERVQIENNLLGDKIAALQERLPQHLRAVGQADDEMEFHRQATRMQVAQQTDSLHRHYDASRNPIHVWKAVHLFAGQQPREPFPEWVMSYLGSGARKIVLMGEGLDWTAEPAPPPPAERNKETLAEYGRQHSAWSQALDYKSGQSHAAIGRAYDAEPSLNYSKVNRLVLKALGFSAVTGKNFFSEYFNMLCMQEYVREYNHSSSEQDRLWRYARQHARERLSRLGPSRLAQPAIWENITEKPVTDPSNCRRIVQEAQRYLERGRIEPEPLGPVNAWIAQRQHRKFLKDIE